MLDRFQSDYTASAGASLTAWDAAIASYLDFSGTPVGDLAKVEDPAFMAGPAFCAAMKLLSGVDPASVSVQTDLTAMDRAAADIFGAEALHARAVHLLAAGAFSEAARIWDDILVERPTDILALKCSHETWFLAGHAAELRVSTKAALGRIEGDHPAYSVAASQYAFALEETGSYAEAESWARLAITASPNDCWALHCLAHIYETQNRQSDALGLLNSRMPIWREQNLLSAHIWWHLALRLVEAEDFSAALKVYDDFLDEGDPNNRFRLTDGTSLLWRLELAGIDVGDRWRAMADKWGLKAEVHSNGFLDLHAALAFSRCPDAAAADLFFDSLQQAFVGDDSEIAESYSRLVKPLVQAFRSYHVDPAGAAYQIKPLLSELYRIGGSIVQREIVERSYSSALIATGAEADCARFLDPKIERRPNAPWLLRDRARCAEMAGDGATATLLRRRADAMFTSLQ